MNLKAMPQHFLITNLLSCKQFMLNKALLLSEYVLNQKVDKIHWLALHPALFSRVH